MGIWGANSIPFGFTVNFNNVNDSLFIINNADKYSSYKNIILESKLLNSSWKDKNYSFSSQLNFAMSTNLTGKQSKFLNFDGLSTTNNQVTFYSAKNFDDAKDAFIKSISLTPGGIVGILPSKNFGDGISNSYSRMIGIVQPTPRELYYRNAALSLRNNVSTEVAIDSLAEPYYINDIGDRYGIGSDVTKFNFEISLFRFAPTTYLSRATIDAARFAKFAASPKGLIWLTKQIGLQAMSPRPETNPNSFEFGLSFLFNTTQAILGSGVGIRPYRHSIFFGDAETYEKSAEVTNIDKNRLLYFRKNVFGIDFVQFFNIIPERDIDTPGVSLFQHSLYGIRSLVPWPAYAGYLRSTAGNNEGKTETAGTNLKSTGTKTFNNDPTKSYKFKTHKDFETYFSNLNIRTSQSSQATTTNNNLNYVAIDPIKSIKTVDGDIDDIAQLTFKLIYARKRGAQNAATEGSNLAAQQSEFLTFRAIVDSFTDTYSPDISSITYIGNPIIYPIYKHTRRSIQLSFKVPIYWKEELTFVKQKLEKLTSYVYPTLSPDTRLETPYIQFTYAKYVEAYGVITSLVCTIDTQTPWYPYNDTMAYYPAVVNVATTMDVIPTYNENLQQFNVSSVR